MARAVYSLLLYLLFPAIIARLLWRGLRNPAYWQRWRERFGWIHPPVLHEPIWVHAVSVGEVQAAVALLRALQQQYPQRSIVITTMTPTGSARVQHHFGTAVYHVYLPYDYPGAVARFLERVQPRLGVIMETELWPNLFAHCAARNIPTVIANARLSPRSMRGYQKIAGLARQTLTNVRLIAAQTQADVERFLTLGAVAEKVMVMGNIKYDQHLPGDSVRQAQDLRTQWGSTRPVWIAASTHEGEEELLLDVHARLRQRHADLLLIIAPRHPERFARVAALAQARGYCVARRTSADDVTSDADVFVLDTLGDLLRFYAAADVAFIGGSLVPVGGHNMLEAAALRVPVIFGPHVFNFGEISQALLQCGGACQVSDTGQLHHTLEVLLADAQLRQQMGAAGEKLVADNRGAIGRLLACIKPLLGEGR